MPKLHFDVQFEVDEEAVPKSTRPRMLVSLRKMGVLEMLREGIVSESLAAQMLGVSRAALFKLMAVHGIAHFDVSASDLRHEIAVATEDRRRAKNGRSHAAHAARR